MSGKPDSERWKQKYYDSLEQIEKKERQWQDVEGLLRRGIARLTLAARGVNDTLDRELERLRNAIRDGRDSAALQQLIEAIGNSVARQDQGRACVNDPKAGETLAQLLSKIALPRRFSRKARALGSRLENARSQAELTPLMDELCALLQEALVNEQPARDAPDPLSASDKPDSPGLIKKLFGFGVAGGREEDTRGGSVLPPPQPEASAAHFEINAALQRLLAGLTLPQRHASRLALLKERVRSDLAQIEGERVLDDLALLISDALRQDAPPPAPHMVEQAPLQSQPALQAAVGDIVRNNAQVCRGGIEAA